MEWSDYLDYSCASYETIVQGLREHPQLSTRLVIVNDGYDITYVWPIHYLLRHPRPDLTLIRHVLDSGCSVNQTDDHGRTPLMMLQGNASLFDLLMRYNPDITRTSNDQNTFLHHILLDTYCVDAPDINVLIRCVMKYPGTGNLCDELVTYLIRDMINRGYHFDADVYYFLRRGLRPPPPKKRARIGL